ncbi:unnamed protein product [Orchesella dallaii]|uniref:PPM-type phosphatase domain-containing protein n=1 Tax=Orchesella dallaii TaxID=48710 RepID=A0ABP1RWQ2_9HEXA
MEARAFLENFQVTDIEKDPLPIKVLRNAITKEEILGQAVYWGFEYLDSRSCPLSLIYRILQKLYEEIPQTDFLHCAEENHAGVGDEAVGASSPEPDARYEPLKLMQAIVKKIDEICLREREDVHDSVDGIIEAPDMLPNVHAVSYNNIKNTRRFMEDRMTVLPRMDRLFNLPAPMSYFAVFDGHNGSEAAAYGAAQLHQYLIKSMIDSTDLFDCISNAFEHLDEVFVQKCRAGKIKSGSTAVISLLMADKVYVAWAGDSQAVLVKQNEVNNLVNPHKPERLDEVERIRSLGGEVLNLNGTYRVHGNLAVSRAIGDADEKPFIIATPDIKMQELDGSEEFLILGCDGLWDEITPEAAAHIVRRQVVEDASNVSAVSNKLIQEAKQKGSTDNITVIVVFFQPLESIKNHYESTISLDSGVDTIMSKFETLSFNTSEKLIENTVDGKISPLKEINGHGKDGEPLVDFLSLGSSKESGGQPITDDTDQFGDDDDKDVEQLSDAEPDDEWQFEKPENPGLGTATLDIQFNQTVNEDRNEAFESTFIQEISNNQKESAQPDVEIIQKSFELSAPIDSSPVPDLMAEISDKISEPLNPFMMEAETIINGNENDLDATIVNSSQTLSNGGNLFEGETTVNDITLPEVDQVEEEKPVVISGTLATFLVDEQPTPDPFDVEVNFEQVSAQPNVAEIDLVAPSPNFDIQNMIPNESVAAGDAGLNPFGETSTSDMQMNFNDIGMPDIPLPTPDEDIGLGDINTQIETETRTGFMVGGDFSDPFAVGGNLEQVPPLNNAEDIGVVFSSPNFDLQNTTSGIDVVSENNPFAEPPQLVTDSQMNYQVPEVQPTPPENIIDEIGLDDNASKIVTGVLAEFIVDEQASSDTYGTIESVPPLPVETEFDLVAASDNFGLPNPEPIKDSVPDLATFGDELISTSNSHLKINGVDDDHFNLQEEASQIIEKSEVISNVETIITDSTANVELLVEPDVVASNISAITTPEPEVELIQKSIELPGSRSVEFAEEIVPDLPQQLSDKPAEPMNPFMMETETSTVNGIEKGLDEILENEPPVLTNGDHLFNEESTVSKIDEVKVEEKTEIIRDLLPDFQVDEQKPSADRLESNIKLQQDIEPPQAVVEEIIVAKSATPDLQTAPVTSEVVAEATPLVEEVKVNGVEEHIIQEVPQPAEKSKIVRNVETKNATAAKTAKLPAKPDGAAPKLRAPITSAPARKSPTKPPTTTAAPPKSTLMNGKSTAATKPTAPRSTAAPKPAPGRVGGAPATTAPRTATSRLAPTSARPLAAKKDGAEAKPATNKTTTTSTLKARPATAPSMTKPAPPKPMTTTSPKRVPPTTTARTTTITRPTTASKLTTTSAGAKPGESDGKTGSAALSKPRPRPMTATASRVPGKPDIKPAGTERKLGTGTTTKTGNIAPRTASKPLTSRPVPTTTRTVTKTTTATASKPATARTVSKPATAVAATAEPLQNNNSTN